MRIGILDANVNFLDFLSSVLQMAGHTVVTYTTRSLLLDALYLLPSGTNILQHDLVILDLHFAETKLGVDLLITIRKKYSAEQLPIIIMTEVDEKTFQQWKLLLPDDILLLRKPFHPHTLLQTISIVQSKQLLPSPTE